MASITKLPGRTAFACLPGGTRLSGTGLSGAAATRPATIAVRDVDQRPIQAPAVVAAERFDAYGASAAAVANGAGHQTFGQQKTRLHSMWALRGLDPWSDPT
jgi:hypothetical protein